MPSYRPVDAPVRNLAEQIIAKHHEHLKGHRVDVIFRNTAAKQGPKVVLGKARKITGLNAFLADEEGQPFFVVELAEDEWVKLDPQGQAALIDHELEHCWIDYDEETGDPVISILPHDVQEFTSIVARRGLWTDDLALFGRAVQLALPGTEEPMPEPVYDAGTGERVPVGAGAGQPDPED